MKIIQTYTRKFKYRIGRIKVIYILFTNNFIPQELLHTQFCKLINI